MGFLNSFYGQMGRNTGKVFSNMIFGNSWSTPIRHITSKGGGSSGGGGSSSFFTRDTMKSKLNHEKEMADKALELEKLRFQNEKEMESIQRIEGVVFEIKSIKFGNNVDEICSQLDNMIINAEKLQSEGTDSSFIVFKIRSGILKLQSIGALVESEFYVTQLRLYHRHKFLKMIGLIVMLVFCLTGLLLIGQMRIKLPKFW
jgi:hypothetical protein